MDLLKKTLENCLKKDKLSNEQYLVCEDMISQISNINKNIEIIKKENIPKDLMDNYYSFIQIFQNYLNKI